MWLVSFAATLAVCWQFVSWYGLLDQIRVTSDRRTTQGLSLTEAESRLWGKLPWLLFACSLPSIDWTVLATNTVSIALAASALLQFVQFRTESMQQHTRRVYLQLILLFSTLIVCTLWRETLRIQSTFWCVLPVAFTVCALSIGSISQFRENRRRRDTSALSLTRYVTLTTSYLLWFAYGCLKGSALGWDGAWTICVSTGLGLVANSAVLAQFYIYRRPIQRRTGRLFILGEEELPQRA